MQPLRRYSSTTSGGKPSCRGALSQFVLMEVFQFVLYFLFFFNNSATILNFLFGYGHYTLFAYYWPGSFPGSSVCNSLHYVVRRTPFSTTYLSNVDCTVDFARETLQSDRFAVITTTLLTKDNDWK